MKCLPKVFLILIVYFLILSTKSIQAQTPISGTISSNTTLTKAGSPYLVNPTTVEQGVTLTIEAGAVLKFNAAGSIDVYGTLNVNGTSSEPVIITSIKDDSDGNDSNNDGNSSFPANGDWAAIWMRETSTGDFKHTYFLYGGGEYTSAALNIYSSQVLVNSCRFDNSWQRGIYLEGCSPDINNCSFTGNQLEGLYFNGLDASKALEFSNNTFTDNDWAVLGELKDATVGITLSGNSSTGSSHNGFGMFGGIAGDITLDGNDGFPFIVNGTVTVSENAGLTITEGTVFKYGKSQSIIIHGSLTSGGTELNPVVFTSISDDVYGGNTNNNTEEVASEGYWTAIWMRETSTGDFKHTYFLYGGGEYTTAALNIYSSQIQVNSCRFDNSWERGIYLEGCSPDINNCSFTGNQTEGLYFIGLDANKEFIFSNNSFTDNVNWAVLGKLEDATVGITLSGNSSTGSSHNGFGMSGVIGGDITLDGDDGFPFIVNGSIMVSENSGLSISEGTVFKYNGIGHSLDIHGSLTSGGTELNPVVFTSIKDDSYGNDSNNDGNSSFPAYGDWAAIWMRETSTGDFKHTYFLYGGGEYTSAALNIYSSQVQVNSCRFDNSSERGIYLEGCSPDINNCSFTGNQYEGLYFRGLDASKVLEFSNNTFTDNVNWPVFGELKDETVGVTLSGNSSTGSSHNGFGMFGVIGGDNTLDGDDGFPFIVFNILTVSENAGLTISPGSIFKFVDYNSGIWVSGTLNAKGKKDQPIIFTSISDDCFGGDTENDSLNSVPNAYDWGTVGFNEGSSGNMDYCYIMYSGGEAAITIKSDDVVVKHCIISESGYRGISVIAANPKIESNSILMNEVGIQVLAEGNPVIENNRIVSNNKGIINNGAIFITATNNWWGSENGPKNEVYNPDGRGNAVEGNVDIYPWITNQPVGTISGNVPDFDFIIQGNSVEFQNKSENASSFHWNFNDDSESNSSNPYHEYENPGTYEVCLTAQFCDVYETVTKKIQIEGIHSITPLEGGNTGEVTFNVYGGGFTENTSIQLKNSSSVLLPDTTIIIDTDHLVVRFNMFEKPVGEYLIEIIEDGEFLYAATDTFKLQAGEFPEPWVDITSRKAFLSNIWHKLTITYGNTANVDAKGVPFWFAISNHEDMEIEFIDFEIAPIQKKEGFEEFYKDDPFYEVDSFLGEAFNARSLSLYIPVIPANSTQSITMRVKSSETYKTITWLDKPLYHTSYDTVKSMLYNKSGTNLIEDDFIPDPADMTKASCWMSIVFEMVIDAGAGVVNPWVGCIQSVLNNVFDVHGYGGVRPKRKTLQHWVATYSGVAIECAMAHYPKVWIGKIAGITFSNLAYHMTAESCSDAKIKKHNEMRKVTSFDPNEKDGPTGYGESNYIGSTDFLDYTIYFENKSSATAPAHTIIVSDTLDTDIFDLSKTEINSVTIGDTTFYALPGSTEFLKSASLEHLGVDARITVSSNENTGSLNCIIRSFDPDTDEEIEDPFVGVLPPNVTSPEGEGSVSFRLFLKEEPQHNQVIKNKAIIYFDGNEPIITNEYINTFDLQAPVTEVESYTVDGTITLNLSGTDSGSGIDYYEIWMAKGDEGFDLWKISKENTVEFRSTETDNYKFYSVGVDNLGNTEAAPEIADIDVYATSVEIFVITEKVKYYPNPASKKINIEIDLDEAREIDIYITNLNGQNIKCLSNLLLPQGKTTLKENLEGIPNGMYLLNIQIENQIFGDQIIILN